MSRGYRRKNKNPKPKTQNPKPKTEILPANDASVQRAVDVLEAGGVIAFPTDTVYGVGASPWDVDAVGRLYEVKKRPLDRPIPLLLSDAERVSDVAILPDRCKPLLDRFWPGGLTLVLPKKDVVPDIVSARPTVAVRVPDLDWVRDLIREAGGVLAVTSANISDQPSPVTASEVDEQLGGYIDVIIDGGPCPGGVPSTILDCSVSPPQVLRRGAIDELEW
jgi:L-threonylcarbamoyladenylate synthase